MNKRLPIQLAVGIIIIIALIVGGAFYFSSNKTAEEYNDYYKQLAKKCDDSTLKSCCLNSVKAMKEGNYKIAENKICPERYERNGLLCLDSYSWCEPIAHDDYYDQLKEKCDGSSCCLSSLEAMKDGGYKLAGDDNECSDGYKMNSLYCVDAYAWCEPVSNHGADQSKD